MKSGIIKWSIFSLWLVIGLYFGIGGMLRANRDIELTRLQGIEDDLKKQEFKYEIDGLVLNNEFEYQYYLQVRSVERVFPWVADVTGFFSLALTALCFGMLGSLVAILRLAIQHKQTSYFDVCLRPVLGFLTGLAVLGLSYVIPTLFVDSNDTLRPMTLMFLSLFSGIFSERFYEKLSGQFEKIL